MSKRYPNYRWLMGLVQVAGLVLGLVYVGAMLAGGKIGAGGLGTGRDLALIFLGLHALVAVVIGFVLVAALTYGLYHVRLWLQGALRQVTAYARLGQGYAEALSHQIAAPFIWIESRIAQTQALVRALRR